MMRAAFACNLCSAGLGGLILASCTPDPTSFAKTTELPSCMSGLRSEAQKHAAAHGPDAWEILAAGARMYRLPGKNAPVILELPPLVHVTNAGERCYQDQTAWQQVSLPGNMQMSGWIKGGNLREAGYNPVDAYDARGIDRIYHAKGFLRCSASSRSTGKPVPENVQPGCPFGVIRYMQGTAMLTVKLEHTHTIPFREQKPLFYPSEKIPADYPDDGWRVHIDADSWVDVPDSAISGG